MLGMESFFGRQIFGPESLIQSTSWVIGGAAVLAGFAGSVHCLGMCGPLACVGCSRASGRRARNAAALAYQAARLASYALAGAALGLVGSGLFGAFSLSPPAALPWILAGLLIASALGWAEKLPALPGVARIARAAAGLSAKLSPAWRGATLGALTPLLPCGLLYGMFAAAMGTASSGRGAVLAFGFALGSAPALLLAQWQTGWLEKLPPTARVVVRRVIPLAAAALLVMRAMGAPAAEGEPPACH